MDIYARLEDTTDDIFLKYGQGKMKKDVVLYKDKQCSNEFARIPWHYKNRPDRRYKHIKLNCYNYQITWI